MPCLYPKLVTAICIVPSSSSSCERVGDARLQLVDGQRSWCRSIRSASALTGSSSCRSRSIGVGDADGAVVERVLAARAAVALDQFGRAGVEEQHPHPMLAARAAGGSRRTTASGSAVGPTTRAKRWKRTTPGAAAELDDLVEQRRPAGCRRRTSRCPRDRPPRASGLRRTSPVMTRMSVTPRSYTSSHA